MLSIAICDDEKKVSDTLYSHIMNSLANIDSEAAISVFSNGELLLESCLDNAASFDIIFLDIKMQGKNGVEIAKELRSSGVNSLIVFVTSSAEYVFSGYEVKAFRYILKAELETAFNRVFRECLDELKKGNGGEFTVKSGSVTRRVPYREVLYLESDKRKLIIHTRNEMLEVYGKLDELEAESKSDDFVRVHQSYLVNAKKIKSISQNGLQLVDGTELPVSKSRRESLREAYLWAKR